MFIVLGQVWKLIVSISDLPSSLLSGSFFECKELLNFNFLMIKFKMVSVGSVLTSNLKFKSQINFQFWDGPLYIHT